MPRLSRSADEQFEVTHTLVDLTEGRSRHRAVDQSAAQIIRPTEELRRLFLHVAAIAERGGEAPARIRDRLLTQLAQRADERIDLAPLQRGGVV
jgi:hypothetical protein